MRPSGWAFAVGAVGLVVAAGYQVCVAQDVDKLAAPLRYYENIGNKQLREAVLPRLFDAGAAEVKDLKIDVVSTNAFPAVDRNQLNAQPQLQINSALVAVMDRVSEADLRVSATSHYSLLDDYIKSIMSEVSRIGSGFPFFSSDDSGPKSQDWQRWASHVLAHPWTGSENYDPRTYESLRPIVLTNALGIIVAREITELALGRENLRLEDPHYQGQLNARVSSLVHRAKFDAAPASAVLVYLTLEHLTTAPRERAGKIACADLLFQSKILGEGAPASPFRAGQELLRRNIDACRAKFAMQDLQKP